MGSNEGAANNARRTSLYSLRPISLSDLDQIKKKAAYEGLPYQTLIASILHKYASGHLDV
jgi:predicted DNA binding CopG/RHH family protein